jgi:hypothetical protein
MGSRPWSLRPDPLETAGVRSRFVTIPQSTRAWACRGTSTTGNGACRRVDFLIGDAAKTLLEEVGASVANKTAVTLAIIGTDTRVQTGTYFTLARPLSSASITQTLRAAYPLIVRERRRNFRCPVTVPVIMYKQDTQLRCETVNISEGGFAVSTPEALRPGALFRAQFVLPGLASSSNAECEVCWYNDRGLGGLRFLTLPGDQLVELQGWLAHRLEEDLPKSVAERFGHGI